MPGKSNIAEPVGQQEKFYKSLTIDIDDKRTVFELEDDFKKTLGLSIKLFRKSGSMWVQTTLTNNWSLKKQNEEGEFMSAPVIQNDLLEADAGDKEV